MTGQASATGTSLNSRRPTDVKTLHDNDTSVDHAQSRPQIPLMNRRAMGPKREAATPRTKTSARGMCLPRRVSECDTLEPSPRDVCHRCCQVRSEQRPTGLEGYSSNAHPSSAPRVDRPSARHTGAKGNEGNVVNKGGPEDPCGDNDRGDRDLHDATGGICGADDTCKAMFSPEASTLVA